MSRAAQPIAWTLVVLSSGAWGYTLGWAISGDAWLAAVTYAALGALSPWLYRARWAEFIKKTNKFLDALAK